MPTKVVETPASVAHYKNPFFQRAGTIAVETEVDVSLEQTLKERSLQESKGDYLTNKKANFEFFEKARRRNRRFPTKFA
jgi:hypothetical protein